MEIEYLKLELEWLSPVAVNPVQEGWLHFPELHQSISDRACSEDGHNNLQQLPPGTGTHPHGSS